MVVPGWLVAFPLTDLDARTLHLVLSRDLGPWNPPHIPDRAGKKERRSLPLKSLRQEVTNITSPIITLVRSSLMATLKYKGL